MVFGEKVGWLMGEAIPLYTHRLNHLPVDVYRLPLN